MAPGTEDGVGHGADADRGAPPPPADGPGADERPRDGETRARRKKRTLAILIAVAVVLAFLPLAVSLGVFGGDSEPARVGFLPFQSPPGEEELTEAATALVEGAHARFREENDPRLFLIGPSETRRFQDSAEPPEALGRRIGADVVVAGGLRPTDDGQAQVSAAVVRVEDGRSLWTGEMKVADPSDPATRRLLGEWLWDRARRTIQTVGSGRG